MTYADTKSLLAIAIVFMDVNTILVVLRFLTIRIDGKRIALDDIFLALSWVLATAMCIIMITAAAFESWGVPTLEPPIDAYGMPDLSLVPAWTATVTSSEKFFYAQEALLVPQLAFAKLSILFFYRRALVPVPERRGFTDRATLIMIPIISGWAVSFFFAYVFQCGTQFSLIWHPNQAELENEVCVSEYIELVFGVTDVIWDLIILAIPFYRIFTIHLTTGKKFQVAVAFLIGSLSFIGATLRAAVTISTFVGVENVLTAAIAEDPEGGSMFWAMFESGFAVTTVCLPGICPLLNRVANAFDSRWPSFREKSVRSDTPSSVDLGSIRIEKCFEVEVSLA